MIKYKGGILARLKEAGYSSYRIRKEKILGEATMTVIRNGGEPSNEAMNRLCRMLGCQPGDLLEYVPDQDQEQEETGET